MGNGFSKGKDVLLLRFVFAAAVHGTGEDRRGSQVRAALW